jgi:ferrous iron transport protein A
VKVKVHFNKGIGPAAEGEFEHSKAAVTNHPSLEDVPVGGAATIAAVGGSRSLAIRLMEMGLLPGTRVEVVRIAPFGDPIEIRLRGFSLSIRREEARGVRIDGVQGGAET